MRQKQFNPFLNAALGQSSAGFNKTGEGQETYGGSFKIKSNVLKKTNINFKSSVGSQGFGGTAVNSNPFSAYQSTQQQSIMIGSG